MKCVGCGGEIADLGGVYAFGRPTHRTGERQTVKSDYCKTLCPKCTRVIKEILLNSDLSDHWTNETE